MKLLSVGCCYKSASANEMVILTHVAHVVTHTVCNAKSTLVACNLCP